MGYRDELNKLIDALPITDVLKKEFGRLLDCLEQEQYEDGVSSGMQMEKGYD